MGAKLSTATRYNRNASSDTVIFRANMPSNLDAGEEMIYIVHVTDTTFSCMHCNYSAALILIATQVAAFAQFDGDREG